MYPCSSTNRAMTIVVTCFVLCSWFTLNTMTVLWIKPLLFGISCWIICFCVLLVVSLQRLLHILTFSISYTFILHNSSLFSENGTLNCDQANVVRNVTYSLKCLIVWIYYIGIFMNLDFIYKNGIMLPLNVVPLTSIIYCIF